MWKPTPQMDLFHHDLRHFTPQNKKQKQNSLKLLISQGHLCHQWCHQCHNWCPGVTNASAPSNTGSLRVSLGGGQEPSKDGLAPARRSGGCLGLERGSPGLMGLQGQLELKMSGTSSGLGSKEDPLCLTISPPALMQPA